MLRMSGEEAAGFFAEITPTDKENCVAQVRIENERTDNSLERSGQLGLGDLTVGISYRLNAGDDGEEHYTIYPPDGYAAIPTEFFVADETERFAFICRWIGF